MTNSLAWQDKWIARLVQTLSAYSEGSCDGATPQIISGEENYVILKVSLEEWTKLFSSVYTGADFCYPDESDNVRWILQRAVECPVSICDLIIDCIQNNPATLQAIIDGLVGSEEFQQQVTNIVSHLTEAELTGVLVGGSCNWSVVAGKAIAIIERMDQNNIDALENIEVGTNDEEKVENVLEGIPILGELPFDDIIEFTQDILEDFYENYAAASTIERKAEMARDLWCYMLAQDDCEITYEGLFDFFQTRATSGLDVAATALDVVNFVITGDFANDDAVFNGMFAVQSAFILAGREFYGINLPKIGALTRDAEPSSAWIDWETCEPELTCEGGTAWNWLIHQYGFEPFVDRAVWEEGTGWKVNTVVNTTRLQIMRNVGTHPVRIRVWLAESGPAVIIYKHKPGFFTTAIGTCTYVGSDALGHLYELATIPAYTDYLMISVESTGAIPTTQRIRRACVDYDV